MKVQRIAKTGIMLALVIALSILERMIPPLPLVPPSMKLGLPNIVTMYCAIFWGWRDAAAINLAKSVFVFLTRGFLAFTLSISGGMLSVFVLSVLLMLFGKKVSFIILSVLSAIAHNIGQLVAFGIILQTSNIVYYLPVLLVSGVVLGVITGSVLRVVIPAVESRS